MTLFEKRKKMALWEKTRVLKKPKENRTRENLHLRTPNQDAKKRFT